MQIIDPIPWGGDSGMRELAASKAEAATLLRAADIVDKAHALIEAELGDDHYLLGDINLCEAGDTLRTLAANGRHNVRLGW